MKTENVIYNNDPCPVSMTLISEDMVDEQLLNAIEQLLISKDPHHLREYLEDHHSERKP